MVGDRRIPIHAVGAGAPLVHRGLGDCRMRALGFDHSMLEQLLGGVFHVTVLMFSPTLFPVIRTERPAGTGKLCSLMRPRLRETPAGFALRKSLTNGNL